MANVVTPLPARTAPTPATSSAAAPGGSEASPPAALTSAEIAALALSLAHLGAGPQADTARAGLRRLLEITSDTDPSVDDTIVETLTTLTTRLEPDHIRHARTIASSITGRRVVRLSYRDVRGTVTIRDVEPVTCLVHRDSWFLVGWCRLRQSIRAFRFDRLLALEETDIPAPARPAEGFLPFQRRDR